ncbi:hypothetical protein HRbin17_01747 [bacterium HR17]|uniref:Uncharacterized protein n=1 Tax=Candidatus Fervidibacter japonicus TaxID=2035412 RepID=A0A2H5XDH3_9BACT|nr:hypothetical protein HRbin17_01747 [bacterium HR17]
MRRFSAAQRAALRLKHSTSDVSTLPFYAMQPRPTQQIRRNLRKSKHQRCLTVRRFLIKISRPLTLTSPRLPDTITLALMQCYITPIQRAGRLCV